MPDSRRPLTSRYQLEEPIAAGGFGEVWRGTDITLGRTVAVKLLRPAFAQDPVTLARFRAEARHAAALCHPNIASIHDFCEPAPPSPPFLVMEYLTGPCLAALLAAGPMSAAMAMGIVAGAAAGLAAAHQAGLVHRDIKPSNLLFTQDGTVKITDFGISHAAGSPPLTAAGTLIGTPAYMAPERLAGARGTAASDIYALGIVAYHAVTGSAPFTGPPLQVARAHQEQPLPPLPASVPPEIALFISRLTAKNPAARPGNASEVARRAALLSGRLATSPARTRRKTTAPGPYPRDKHTPNPTRVPPGPGRYYWRAALTAAAATVIVLGVRQADVRSPAMPYAAAPYAAQVIPPAADGTSSSGPQAAAAQTVQVRPSSLIGEQVAAAARQLRALGLSVLITWQPAGGRTPGTVISVRPGGQVAVGSRIDLQVARTR